MQKKLAIIGSGIAGMGAAYRLRDEYDITIFEQNHYVGGHTNTIDVDDDGRPLPIDTGFIVYNETTYPNLTRLFAELNVQTENTDMSFSVGNRVTNFEWSGRNVGGIFAQRSNLFKPRFLKFLLEANRFNNTAATHLDDERTDVPMGEYLRRQGYSEYFKENYVLAMGSAVWSTPLDKMEEFPARTLIQFFKNHGMLGYTTQLQWRTVSNGSRNYMNKILAKLGKPVRVNQAVRSIAREANHALVRTDEGEHRFDRVLVAAHGDQALRLLADPTQTEEELLSKFKYEKNRAILHTDVGAMPTRKRAWAAWNFMYRPAEGDREHRTTTVYYMNYLQNLKTKHDYFVSINEFDELDESRIIRVLDYEHPLFDGPAIAAQGRLDELNESGPIFFCGSYFRYGFHEDALWSGLRAAEKIKHAEASLLSV